VISCSCGWPTGCAPRAGDDPAGGGGTAPRGRDRRRPARGRPAHGGGHRSPAGDGARRRGRGGTADRARVSRIGLAMAKPGPPSTRSSRWPTGPRTSRKGGRGILHVVENEELSAYAGTRTGGSGSEPRTDGRSPAQGRGKVVIRALGLGGCHREGATARRSAPSSRRPTNRRVALTWAGGVHSTCRSEPQSILQRRGRGPRSGSPQVRAPILTLPRPWVTAGHVGVNSPRPR
jgi:hypothetical protein